MADVVGLPVRGRVAARIANSIGPRLRRFCRGRRTCVRSEPASFLSCTSLRRFEDDAPEARMLSLTEGSREGHRAKAFSRRATGDRWPLSEGMPHQGSPVQGLHGDRNRRRRWRPPRPDARSHPKGNVSGGCMAWHAGAHRTCIPQATQDRDVRIAYPAPISSPPRLTTALQPTEECRQHSPRLVCRWTEVRLWADRAQHALAGRCINPWDVDRVTGGLESGSR